MSADISFFQVEQQIKQVEQEIVIVNSLSSALTELNEMLPAERRRRLRSIFVPDTCEKMKEYIEKVKFLTASAPQQALEFVVAVKEAVVNKVPCNGLKSSVSAAKQVVEERKAIVLEKKSKLEVKLTLIKAAEQTTSAEPSAKQTSKQTSASTTTEAATTTEVATTTEAATTNKAAVTTGTSTMTDAVTKTEAATTTDAANTIDAAKISGIDYKVNELRTAS